MRKLPTAFPAGLIAALLPVCLITATAQNPPTTPAVPADKQKSGAPNPKDEFLAKTANLYYTAAGTGLTGYTCAVHPDWRALFLTASKGATVADDDPRVVLLKTVKITFHGQLKGESTLDWDQPSNPSTPLDPDSAQMFDAMHNATKQSLMGFMQLWTPFVDGSVLPANSQGMEITQTENGRRIHLDTNGTSVTELFDGSFILRHFDVVTGGTAVNITPSYKPTQSGLLVSAFQAHIQPPGAQSNQAQEIHVEIEYQTLKGSPIPSRINMEALNSGTFNFAFDGCTVNP
jgi:hypothetical protein